MYVPINANTHTEAGELSQTAYVNYVNWWQNIIGIISNNEETASEAPVTPIDQSTCAPCSEFNNE